MIAIHMISLEPLGFSLFFRPPHYLLAFCPLALASIAYRMENNWQTFRMP